MTRKLELSLAVLAAAIGCGGVSGALAQEDNFSRDRNESVRDRPKPEYDAAGMQAGGFRLYPELLLGVEFDDNIFATDTDEQSDTIYHVDPSAHLNSQWSNHELNLALSAPTRIYSEFDDNNTTDVIGSVDGRLDVRRDFYLHGGASYGARHESLASSPTTLPLAEPVEYSTAAGNIGVVKAFNRLRLSGEARYAQFDYDDGVLFNNTPVEQDDRDRTTIELGVRADYAISPMTALFLSAGTNTRDYDLDPPNAAVNRDSNGYEVLAGANFDLTHLVRGEIGVGYLSQSYDEPGVDETSGLALRTHLEWLPDELVTVTFGAAREVQDAGAVGAASYVGNDVSLGVDYEFRRNVVLGARADYSLDDYSGVDREDRRFDTVLSIDYLMNRGVALFGEVGHYEQSSEGTQFGREYDINRAVIGIKLRR